MSKNLSYLSGRKGLDNLLFEKLDRAAEKTGTPDITDMEKLKEEYLFGSANVYGTMTFYDFLKPEHRGKKAYVCNGSACMTAGTQTDVKSKLLKYYTEAELGEMCCLGRCHQNHAFHINGHNYSGSDIDALDSIIHDNRLTHEQLCIESVGTKIITGLLDINKFSALLTQLWSKKPTELIDDIKISGIRGRGGAGFPAYFKYETLLHSSSPTKFIVCNADEGDPGAYSDRFIMERRVWHLMLGMIIAGYVSNAQTGIIYIRAEYPESIQIVSEAILEYQNLMASADRPDHFHFRFKMIKAKGAYICGEETALLSSIEGQRPEVRVRPPFPTETGLFNCPTVINNVETLAGLPYILEHGGEAYKNVGTEKSSGTKLISLDGFFNHPCVIEVDMGTPLATVVYDIGKGFKQPIKALQIGGPLGGVVPVSKINELTVDFESFAAHGFLLGHASIVCIPEHFPMIEYMKHLFEFTAHESCGKCFPCRLGTLRGFELIEKAIVSDFKIPTELMHDLLQTLQLGSLCALGGGVPLPIKNIIQYFWSELEPYFKG